MLFGMLGVLLCTLIYKGDTVPWSVGCYWYFTVVSPERWYLFGTMWCGCYYSLQWRWSDLIGWLLLVLHDGVTRSVVLIWNNMVRLSLVVTMAMVWPFKFVQLFWWYNMSTCLVLSSTMVWPDQCDRRRSSAATSCPTADWTRTVSIVSPVIRFVLIISICIHLSYFQPSRQTTRWCR